MGIEMKIDLPSTGRTNFVVVDLCDDRRITSALVGYKGLEHIDILHAYSRSFPNRTRVDGVWGGGVIDIQPHLIVVGGTCKAYGEAPHRLIERFMRRYTFKLDHNPDVVIRMGQEI